MTNARRLPVYFAIDTSGSMTGEPIESVNVGVENLIASLRQDPQALESVWISLVTYDREVKDVLPLTALEDVSYVDIVCPPSGPTLMGAVLEEICLRVDKEVKSTGDSRDWRPMLFVMTDGKPSDIQLFEEMVPRVRAKGFAKIVGCAAGPRAKPDDLKKFCDDVVVLETMDSASMVKFFEWVSTAVQAGNVSMGATASTELPPVPPELNVVV